MIRSLLLSFGLLVGTISTARHTEPLAPLPLRPITVLPQSDVPHWADASLKNVLTPSKKQQLEDLLHQEFNRLRSEELPLNPNEDDVSDGSIGQPLAEELEMIGRARAVIDELKATGNFLLKFTGDDLVTFPVGISQEIGNVTYTMGIGGIKLRPTHAELEIFLEIDVPGKDPLLFGSPNIKFTKDGGIVGDACLGLLADFAVDIVRHKSVLKLKKAEVDENGTCTTGTYVNISCDGFERLSLDAEVIFSRDWIKPTDGSPNNRVTGTFLTQISSWEDLLINIDLDDFVINRLEDIEFRVSSMVLDFSDTQASIDVVFPDNYVHPLQGTPLWKGFYMEQFRVYLPERLAGGTGKYIDGQGIIIDDSGFTGRVSAYPDLIQLGEADLNKWAFSVDTFALEILQQQFEEVRVAGKINVPIFGNDDSNDPRPQDCFAYAALITADNVYSFSVSPEQDYDVDMWRATATIESNSTLDIVFNNGDVEIDATIHGEISVDGDFGSNVQINIPDISFDNMVISNHGDYFQPGDWELPTGISAEIGTFTLIIDDLVVKKETDGGETRAGLDFEVSVILDGTLEIRATSDLSVTARLDQSGSYQKWRVQDFGINSFYYEGHFPGVEYLNVGLENFDNEAYGSGFRGLGMARFKGIDTEIQAIAQFGKKNGEKYFMVDALVNFGQGIPLGGLEIKGFGGGIYRHMQREEDIDVAMSQLTGGDVTTLGAGLSGIVYQVDPNTALGLKATVVLATAVGGGDGFNANVTFGIEFGNNDTGGIGISRVFLEGVAKFMSPVDAGISPQFASNGNPDDPFAGVGPPSGMSTTVKAYVLIDLNFDIDLYSARMALYIGESESDFVYGNAWAAAEIDLPNNKWWIHVGTPDNRNQVTINVLDALKFELTSYFALGNTNVPGVPAPYTGAGAVDQILQTEFPGYDGRTGNLYNGAGLVFGAGFSFGTDEPKKFLFFYGHFQGGIGFDIGLIKQNSNCTVSTGFNNWYAIGQAYAGFDAELGAHIKFLGMNQKIVIVEALVAAGIKIEAPNPTWVKAVVFYDLNVLGLIEFDGKFKFEAGEHRSAVLPPNCDISAPDPLANIAEVIESVSLSGGQTENVYLGANVIVDMVVPNAREFRINSEDGEEYAFRVSVVSLEILDDSGERVEMGFADPNVTGWSDDQLQYTKGYINFYPAETTLTVEVVARIEEEITRQDGSTGWVFARNPDTDEFYEEIKTLEFTTSSQIDVIPSENVKMSYPLPGQQNFFVDQYSTGYYVLLRSNQNYLEDEVPEGYKMRARFRNSDGSMLIDEVPFFFYVSGAANIYDEDNRPGSEINISKVDVLQTSTDYIMELAWVHQGEGPLVEPYGEEHVLHQTTFHTSKFRNLGEKLAAIQQIGLDYQDGGNNLAEGDVLVSKQNTPELFDNYDLFGVPEASIPALPLIQMRIVKKDCDVEYWGAGDWYCNEAYYLDYAYPYFPDCAVRADLEPPLDAVQLFQGEDAVDHFDLHFSFPAKVYEHATTVYNYLEESNSCYGQGDTPPVPPSPGGDGFPVNVGELPANVEALRAHLVNGTFDGGSGKGESKGDGSTDGNSAEQAAVYQALLKQYTNIQNIRTRDPRDAAITLRGQYDKGGEVQKAIGDYQRGYDAAMQMSDGGRGFDFSYRVGSVTTGGGAQAMVNYNGGGIIMIGDIPFCMPQWTDEYCNYPILPADVYPGAEFEIEVTYKLPYRPTVNTPSKGTFTITNL
ncbi:MAG: hypothetical protein AAFR05_09795 [Bacteroidota bacterium]